MRASCGVAGGTGCDWSGGVSLSFSGMAGWFLIVKGPLSFAPKSGFLALRYRVYQLRSTLSFNRFVSLPIFLAPVAWLLGNVRNASRSTGSAPLEIKYAFRKAA